MKVCINGSLELPDIIMSLLIGATPDPDKGFSKSLTITLGEEDLIKLSSILHLMYSDEDRLQDAKNGTRSVIERQSINTQKEQVREAKAPETIQKQNGERRSIADIKRKSKALVGGAE